MCNATVTEAVVKQYLLSDSSSKLHRTLMKKKKFHFDLMIKYLWQILLCSPPPPIVLPVFSISAALVQCTFSFFMAVCGWEINTAADFLSRAMTLDWGQCSVLLSGWASYSVELTCSLLSSSVPFGLLQSAKESSISHSHLWLFPKCPAIFATALAIYSDDLPPAGGPLGCDISTVYTIWTVHGIKDHS